MTPLDAMNFYTKLFTGMILLLNIGLLVSIRMALKHARHSSAVDQSEAGVKLWNSAKRGIAVLIIVVICTNGAAIYSNHRMVTATQDIAAELPLADDTEIAMSFGQ